MNNTRLACAVAVGLQVLVAGCGGGGDAATPASPSTQNQQVPPAISTQPANASALSGTSVTFSVSASGSGLAYQWKKNGAAISGATAASYTLPAVTHLDHGAQFTVTVSNAVNSVTSQAARLDLLLSENQRIHEDLSLPSGSGSYLLHWNLNLSGGQTSGVNYAYSDFGSMAGSPLTQGPQSSQQSVPRNLAATLALPASEAPTRILKNGTVLVVPATRATSVISYAGGDVQVDTLASDNATVAYTQLRSAYTTVALTGAVANAPADFAQWHNSFFSNPAILTPGATFGAGAGYIKFTATNKGDRYNVFDCTTPATTDANVVPCVTATSLVTAMAAGMVSNSDRTTYLLANGTLGTVGGIPVWVATAPRPLSATLSTTVQHRIYFERNGNVYTGALIKDGTVLGGSSFVSNPGGATQVDRLTFLPFHIRMNQAAHDSLAAALAL